MKGGRKDDASVKTNFANARVPKYTARSLFLKAIVYILGRNHISWLRGEMNEVPQRDEDVQRCQEKQGEEQLSAARGSTPGWGDGISTELSPPIHADTG